MPSIPIKEKIVEMEEAFIKLRVDGIVEVTYKNGVVIDLELQTRMYIIFNELCKDGKRPFLFSAFDDVSVTPEARENATKTDVLFPGIASAVVATNFAYKLVANFYLKVNRPKHPYRVFSDQESAVKWLLSFVD